MGEMTPERIAELRALCRYTTVNQVFGDYLEREVERMDIARDVAETRTALVEALDEVERLRNTLADIVGDETEWQERTGASPAEAHRRGWLSPEEAEERLSTATALVSDAVREAVTFLEGYPRHSAAPHVRARLEGLRDGLRMAVALFVGASDQSPCPISYALDLATLGREVPWTQPEEVAGA